MDTTIERHPNDDHDFREKVHISRLEIEKHFHSGRSADELDICGTKPADLTDFAFVGRLPKRTSQSSFYRCSYCERDNKFGSGRIVLARCDSRLRLIGDVCHRKHMEADRYAAEVADQRQHELRRAFREISDDLEPLIDELIPTLHKLVAADDSFLQWLSKPLLPESSFPALRDEIVAAVRRDGVLHIERLVEASAFQDAIQRVSDDLRNPENKRRYLEKQPVHRLVAPNTLLKAERVCDEAQTALQRAFDIRRLVKETSWPALTNRAAATRIDKVREHCRTVVGALSSIERRLRERRSFFRNENIKGFVKWASDNESPLLYHDYGISHRGRGFRVEQNATILDVVPPDILVTFTLPDHRRLSELTTRF